MNYYLSALKNYAGFSGRARRAEFWMYHLFTSIAYLVLLIVGVAIHFPLLGVFYGAAVLVPELAVLTRRLHDTNRPGSWILISLVPVIGAIVLLVFTCTDGTPGANEYGYDPKGRGRASVERQPFSQV